MLNWNTYRDELIARLDGLRPLTPDPASTWLAAHERGDGPGNAPGGTHLDAKTRALIALSVAVTARCGGSIAIHADAAAEAGASRQEIAEALGVAVAMNTGAALVYSARVMELVSGGRR
ncbi:carboxymuconolactone decarboxylase family protein [Burkholderia sp. 22PA0099]|uniref:carboxymuconolactone decarboxylase family protein n=1 Tax=Burkholderia sp. 22PA0099 TaxID=3237372 RepID=UPI0039C33ACA